MNAGQRKRPRGFSLIELMVSMGIGSMVLLVAATMLGTTGDGYERVGGGVGAEREARALMNQLAADLSTAVWHEDMEFTGGGGDWPLDRLGFLSLQPSDAQSEDGRVGDLCAVTYYVKDLTIGGKTVRCLMRGFRESSATFEAIRGGTVGSLIAAEEPADDVIAFNVISFEARPVAHRPGGALGDANPHDPFELIQAQVKLVIARRELAAKLSTAADWDGAGQAGRLLGNPSQADRNEGLEIYATLIRFGHHESN